MHPDQLHNHLEQLRQELRVQLQAVIGHRETLATANCITLLAEIVDTVPRKSILEAVSYYNRDTATKPTTTILPTSYIDTTNSTNLCKITVKLEPGCSKLAGMRDLASEASVPMASLRALSVSDSVVLGSLEAQLRWHV